MHHTKSRLLHAFTAAIARPRPRNQNGSSSTCNRESAGYALRGMSSWTVFLVRAYGRGFFFLTLERSVWCQWLYFREGGLEGFRNRVFWCYPWIKDWLFWILLHLVLTLFLCLQCFWHSPCTLRWEVKTSRREPGLERSNSDDQKKRAKLWFQTSFFFFL